MAFVSSQIQLCSLQLNTLPQICSANESEYKLIRRNVPNRAHGAYIHNSNIATVRVCVCVIWCVHLSSIGCIQLCIHNKFGWVAFFSGTLLFISMVIEIDTCMKTNSAFYMLWIRHTELLINCFIFWPLNISAKMCGNKKKKLIKLAKYENMDNSRLSIKSI